MQEVYRRCSRIGNVPAERIRIWLWRALILYSCHSLGLTQQHFYTFGTNIGNLVDISSNWKNMGIPTRIVWSAGWECAKPSVTGTIEKQPILYYILLLNCFLILQSSCFDWKKFVPKVTTHFDKTRCCALLNCTWAGYEEEFVFGEQDFIYFLLILGIS